MKVVDMHCDTISLLLEKEQQGLSSDLFSNDVSIDVQKLRKGKYCVQNFALFTNQKTLAIPEQQTMRMYDKYCREMEANKAWIAPIYAYKDIEENEKAGKISSLLTLEDGGVVFNDLAMLRNYYRMGVRMIALTWNYPNGIGYPNLSMDDLVGKEPNYFHAIDTKQGLTSFGLSYIEEMERLGIIIDVSHLNDAGFYDVLNHTQKPFVASHSNARSVCGVARNLSDDMICELAKRNGVMGINFCSSFLKKDADYSCIEDMVQHILYIRKLAGIDVIGLGTDFDGISSQLEIKDASAMYLLEEALRKAGLSEAEIEKIFYRNVLRVYQEILK